MTRGIDAREEQVAHFFLDIQDPETIRLIIEAHRAVVSDKERQLSLNDGSQPWDHTEDGAVGGYFAVNYTLDDGRVVRRHYPNVTVFASEVGDPASVAGALTALNSSETVMLARALGRDYFSADNDPRALPDLRFTGGDAYVYDNDAYREQSRTLTAHEAELLYDAVLRDVAAGHVSGSLFESESILNGNVTLYATYPSDVPPGRDMTSYNLGVTERMTETVATLRAMDIDVTFG